MIALILAAGKGARLLPHTGECPKPLFPIGGRPLLSIVIEKLAAAGCRRIVINTHHLSQRIASFIHGSKFPVPIDLVEEKEILETGGAIKNLSHYFREEPMVVVNSDILFDIDLSRVYDFHLKGGQEATLVLHDCPEFNKVTVDPRSNILSFEEEFTAAGDEETGKLAFTGIQVISPSVTAFFPEKSFFSSIDIYRNIIGAGGTVKGFVAEKPNWKDIGTPARYRDAVFDTIAKEAFESSFPGRSHSRIERRKLAGDGSDRGWYRVSSETASLIMADHGITTGRATAEVDSFRKIGTHLFKQGLPVPEIYLADRFSGLVFMEDLGDINLETVVKNTGDHGEVLHIYGQVIEILLALSCRGKEGFDPSWTFQTEAYDRELILQKECRYFVESFLTGYMGLKSKFSDFEEEFILLAEGALKYPVTGFMHRDLQSRNIMVKGDRHFLIDFQSGRTGPLQYDLASLLIDPYVDLAGHIKEELLYHAAERVLAFFGMEKEKFIFSYRYCALARNLQMLGAFAHLSRNRGKTWFEKSIPIALRNLKESLDGFPSGEFSSLRQTVNKIEVS